MVKPLVLVADDNINNTEMLSDMLAFHGYQILQAYNGIEVFERIAENPLPDLILLDVMMPGMDGIDVCKKLKSESETRDIPVVFLSALNESEHIIKGLEAGGVDYIGKPFRLQEVLARVKTHITVRMQHLQLKEQYFEIERLQRTVRKFISQKALESIQAQLENKDTNPEEPEFETMTVMFTDIADFTAISEHTNPKVLIADLLIYMNTLSEAVHQNNGQIDKFLGDGVFAFFEDANDALNAAIDIQREIVKFNAEQEQNGRNPFRTRIGLATGDILQTTFGFNDRFEYTTIGDRVNTASRLQSESPIGGVIMDEATFIAVGQPKNLIQDKIILKGKQEAEQTYAIAPEDIL